MELTLTLPDDLAELVRQKVATGDYPDAGAVIRDALTLWGDNLEGETVGIAELRRLWDEGVASGDAGEFDIEDVTREVRARRAARG